MSNTKIQIRRSTTNASVTGLANGELAFTSNGTGTAGQGLLYIGDPGGSSPIVIGGKYNFGVLTANQALVTNATSFIDKVLVANLAPTQIWANGGVGAAGNVLMSGAAGNCYWGSVAAGGVTITIGDGLTSTQSPLTTSGTMAVNLASAPSGLQFTSGGLAVNTTWLGTQAANNASYLGGTAASGYQTTAGLSSNVATLSANNASYLGGTAASGYQTTAGLSSNVATLSANNSSYLGGTAASGYQTTAGLSSNVATLAANSATYVTAGNSIVSNSTGVHVVVANGLSQNTTKTWVNAGNSIVSNTTGVHVVVGNGLSQNTTSTWVNGGNSIVSNSTGVHVAVGNGLSQNTTSTWVNAGNGMVSNSTGIHVLPNTGIISNSTGVFVNSSYIGTIASNTTAYLATTAANSQQFTIASGVLTVNTTGIVQLQDLTLGGNLTVQGTLVTIDTTNLVVNDNIIVLARNQPTAGGADNVDSGFATAYGNTSNTWYAGIARIKSSSTNTNPLFQVFATNTIPGTTTLTGLNTGTLQSYLAPWGAGGALVVNSTAMVITSNGSVVCNLTVNNITSGTLSLGTALAVSNIAAGTDGQVLTTNNTTITWGGLDGGTF